MAKPELSDGEFIRLFEQYGAAEMARRLGKPQRGIFARRTSIEGRIKRQLTSPTNHHRATRHNISHPGRINLEVKDGIVLVGSDAHYWPGPASLMHRAFIQFCKELKPSVVILNGDVIDACTISRHPPIGWAKLPTVREEIEAAQERLGEIEAAAFQARKCWVLGNHDSRYETKIATVAPELRKVFGTSLSDHYPLWEPCWSVFINDDVVVKHRFKGGVHAPHNNTVHGGRTMITGHLHSAKVTPFSDYNGTRYGVDTGCIADPDHRAFLDYTEDSPKNWRDGFCVLTFIDGRMLPPDLVLKWDSSAVTFQGKLMRIESGKGADSAAEIGTNAIKTRNAKKPGKEPFAKGKRLKPRPKHG